MHDTYRVAFVLLALVSGLVLSFTAGTVEEKVVSEVGNEQRLLTNHKARERRDIQRSGLKIGLFSPVVCEAFHRHKLRNDHYHRYKPQDCQEVQRYVQRYPGKRWIRSGVYTIYPNGGIRIKVYCDMKTAGGGWTVFQHRYDGSVNFYRTWSEYKTGFGKLHKEFWLGNDNMHRITEQGKYKLRIQMEDFSGNKRYAEYSSFNIADENHKYRLNIGSFSGTAGNSLSPHNNAMFSTKDRDNDNWGKSCSNHYKGGWWYTSCYLCNLNGLYKHSKTTADPYNRWSNWPGGRTNMKTTTMMMRKI